ncbi:hypothetical protein VDP41_05995 [Xanthomonas campestris pv. campestris]|nr:hypothetical protein [Xanthomonas campestris pv. campestris]MEB1146671.1 hypothetical protein [Xanthomonas campestris pv. campestris]MEB1936983.1 hypothetical protein [Xanthomonas campestris pv. campestris]
MHYNYGTVASIEGGKVTLCWRGHRIVARQTGSLRQAMRFVERWMAARSGLPGARKPPRRTGDGERIRWPVAPRPCRQKLIEPLLHEGPTQAEMDAMENIGSKTITWG